MKKVINFSKGFVPCAILSCVIIAFGIVGFFVKHINFGIDFKPGLIEEIRIAPVALDVTYNGNAKATIDFERDHVDVVISGTGAENQTKSFVYSSYPTVKEVSDALNTVDGVSSVVRADGDVSSYSLFVNSSVSTQLTKDAFRVYAKNLDITIDEVRSSLEVDPRRQEYVLNRIAGGQVFITCCENDRLDALLSGKVFHIHEGVVL